MRVPTDFESRSIRDAFDAGHRVFYIKYNNFDGFFRTFNVRELIMYMSGTILDSTLLGHLYLGNTSDLLTIGEANVEQTVDLLFERSMSDPRKFIDNIKARASSNPQLMYILSLLQLAPLTYSDFMNSTINDILMLQSSAELFARKHTPVDGVQDGKIGRINEVEEYRFTSDG